MKSRDEIRSLIKQHQSFLAERFGKVDLIPKRDIRKELRETIFNEVVDI